MKEKDSRLQVFLEKYQQTIFKSKKKKHSSGFYFYTLLFGCIILLSLIVNVWSSKPPPAKPSIVNLAYDDYPEEKLEPLPEESHAASALPVIKEKNSAAIIRNVIKNDDTLWKIFKENKMSHSLMYDLIKASKGVYNLNRLRAGEVYTITLSKDNEFREFTLETKNEKIVKFVRENGIVDVSIAPVEYETKLVSINSAINNSLFEAIISKGESSHFASLLADIFAWQIDFILDIRKGDEFKAVFEKKYRDGKFVKYGRILAAEFTNKGKEYTAVFFEDGSGHKDYYTYNGKSLRKQFLKSPLRYTRISSGFTRSRFHPILKRYLPHLGIDYAAPYGTPVRSVGDGKVTWAKRKGPNGHLIVIKHNHIYTTTYAHLSRYAKRIKRGVHVKQGQVIGYVGSTGRSTGPHLDFHIKKHGRSVNPLTIKIPHARSIAGKYKNDFIVARDRILVALNSIGKDIVLSKKR